MALMEGGGVAVPQQGRGAKLGWRAEEDVVGQAGLSRPRPRQWWRCLPTDLGPACGPTRHKAGGGDDDNSSLAMALQD